MKNKLPEEFKNKWVAALQSGEYKQTTGKLGSVEEGFCCLGLACHISGLKFNSRAWSIKSVQRCAGKIKKITGVSKIPSVIRGDYNENKIVKELMSMNDDDNQTFFEIGEWIKENL